uniref:ribosomal protein L4 n=1 Tax=Catenella fusiformis TaxID=3024791 RepID=UPI0027DA70CC|nr:ribosomal protein L4 [Catenella fusiformis]WCH57561.1 ribosomal protein L4 [Catenella fusiformis]
MIEQQLKYRVLTDNNNQTVFKSIRWKTNGDKSIYLVHRALVQQLNNKREGNANTKTRSEVRGGGKKPWKQKGTGRARAGSIRSPLWRGGGVIFGPKHKIYNIKLNRKERQLALKNIIYNKFNNTIVVQQFLTHIQKPSTKLLLESIKNLGVPINRDINILIITTSKDKNLYLSKRNVQNVDLIDASQLNTIALLKANYLIITSNALDTINKTYNA